MFIYIALVITVIALIISVMRQFCCPPFKSSFSARKLQRKIELYEQFRRQPAVLMLQKPPLFLKDDGSPFELCDEYEFKMRDIHPASHIPSKGYKIQFDAVSSPEIFDFCFVQNENEKIQLWFRPMNNVHLDDFMVVDVSGGNVRLKSQKFGVLNFPVSAIALSSLKEIKIGDKMSVTQNTSWSLDFGYRIYFTVKQL